MTTNTEALREQFELYVNPEGDIKLHRLVDGSYAGHGLNQSWMDFQAGHAAGVAAEREVEISLWSALNVARAALATAAQPPAGFVLVPIELAQRVQETMGEFLMDHGWRQQDMDTYDEFDAALAAKKSAS